MTNIPRFCIGDDVKWAHGEFDRGRIVLGPFLPGLTLFDGGIRQSDYSYGVRFGEAFIVLADSALAPLPNWVPCPGEHRPVGGWLPDGYTWERFEP